MIGVLYGEGEGKTTSLFGHALRAAGRGWHVGIFQFLKNGDSGEHISVCQCLPHVDIYSFGPHGRVIFKSTKTERDKRDAMHGWEKVEKTSLKYELVCLDEIFPAIELGFIPVERVTSWLDRKPRAQYIFMTGRNLPPEIAERADLASQVCNIKHWYDKGIKAVKGIEF